MISISCFVLVLIILMARVSAVLTDTTADLTLKEAFNLYNSTANICNEQLGFNLTVHVNVHFNILLFLEGDNDDPDILEKINPFAKCMDQEGKVGSLMVFPGSPSSFVRVHGPFLSSSEIEANNVETMSDLYDKAPPEAEYDTLGANDYMQHRSMLLSHDSLHKYRWSIQMLFSTILQAAARLSSKFWKWSAPCNTFERNKRFVPTNLLLL